MGFGYTKAYTDEDKIFIQPSSVSEYTAPPFGFKSIETVLVGNREFVTGEMVKNCGLKATPTVRGDFFTNDEACDFKFYVVT